MPGSFTNNVTPDAALVTDLPLVAGDVIYEEMRDNDPIFIGVNVWRNIAYGRLPSTYSPI